MSKIKTYDRDLKNLYDFARSFKIGIRLSDESQYLPNPSYKHFGGKRGNIGAELLISDLFNASNSRETLANKVALTIAHELGHFLVAPKGRKYKKDYGIVTKDLSERSMYHWDLDEAKACLIHAYLLKHFRFDQRMKVLKDPLSSWRRRVPRIQKARREAWKWWNKEGQLLINNYLKKQD